MTVMKTYPDGSLQFEHGEDDYIAVDTHPEGLELSAFLDTGMEDDRRYKIFADRTIILDDEQAKELLLFVTVHLEKRA
jgi:hypothetical protein